MRKAMETTDKVINKLFYVMRCEYGSYWVILIGDDPIMEIKQRWLDVLHVFTAEEIGKAVKSVKQVYKERPPDLLQFFELTKNLKNTRVGHESTKTFDYGEMEKTGKSGFRERIKEECGV